MDEKRLLMISRRLHRAAEDRDTAQSGRYLAIPEMGNLPAVWKEFSGKWHARRVGLLRARVGMLLYALHLECNPDPVAAMVNSVRAAFGSSSTTKAA